MNKEAEKRIAAKLAKTMAMLCVRNTYLETIHAGMTPITRTGDWSDVTVVDADGNRIPRTEVSHISDIEMRDLMRDIVNRLYTFHLCTDNPRLQAEMELWMANAGKWDEPEMDQRMIGCDTSSGAVAELVGIEGGVVSGLFNPNESGVEALEWRPRHDEHYHEARCRSAASRDFGLSVRRLV